MISDIGVLIGGVIGGVGVVVGWAIYQVGAGNMGGGSRCNQWDRGRRLGWCWRYNRWVGVVVVG